MCGLLCEVVLRIAGYGNLEIYEPDARLYWRLKPNQDCYTKVDRRPVHINSRGDRGHLLDGWKQSLPTTLVSIPTLDELESMNPSPALRAKRVVSPKLAAPLVDLSPDLAAGKALYLDGDPVHLDARGNEIVARRLFEIISAQLRR